MLLFQEKMRATTTLSSLVCQGSAGLASYQLDSRRITTVTRLLARRQEADACPRELFVRYSVCVVCDLERREGDAGSIGQRQRSVEREREKKGRN